MKSYQKALNVLQKGGVIIFPCDTVMGIGCAMDRPNAIKRLYKFKRRPRNQPTAVLVSDEKMARGLMAKKPDKLLKRIMQKYWPGGLTIIVEASEVVPRLVTGGTSDIGIRMPDFPKLHEMIGELGGPIVATSANFKGEPAPVKFSEIKKDFLKLVDYAIEEDSTGTEASTVIKYLGDGKVKYLRKGDLVLDLNK